ncbi:MAG: transposase [Terriglobales bacterium]
MQLHSGVVIRSRDARRRSASWLVEKPFGWLKQIGPLKKVKLRGLAKVDWLFVFSCAAFNLIRIPKLRAQSA